MTLSAFLLSVLSGNAPHAHAADRGSEVIYSPRTPPPATDEEELRRCKFYRKSFAMTEIALPAPTLRNRAIAKWVRDHRVTIDVRSGEELATALAAGVRLQRLTLYADALSESELCAAVKLGVGRVVAASVQHIELMRSVVAKRAQDVVIGMTDVNSPFLAVAGVAERVPVGFRFDSNESDTAIAAVLDHEWLNLVGLHCEVGPHDHDFVSYPAAIGHMIAEMTQIRRNHRIVLTRLGLGGGRAVPSGNWPVELPQLATQIDESLDDACGTLRFPRPLVVLSTGLEIIGRSAA
ncbi:MAG: diaminopimelate decarboxylase [Mycobacterium sp.]|nr:diaminopimelate decarboxylase [Mycobacterium sp.]